MISENLYRELSITTWQELLHAYEGIPDKGSWFFRGVHKSGDFMTSFERALVRMYKWTGDEIHQVDHRRLILQRIGPQTVSNIEFGLIRRFQRQAQHYRSTLPRERNILEWLALMQHFGTPTRLLDWTYSFYVALFFAIDRADGDCEVWALNRSDVVRELRTIWTAQNIRDIDDHDPNLRLEQTFLDVFRRQQNYVCPVNPYSVNERNMIQQGIFLCPGNETVPFEDNLTELLKTGRVKLIKFVIRDLPDLRQEIIKQLRDMNMTSATLFPGLDGFAKSLTGLLLFPDILRPSPRYRR